MHRDLPPARRALRHHDRRRAHASRLRAGCELSGPGRGRLGPRRRLTYPSSRAPATFRISAERRWSGSGDFQYGQWRCQPVGTCPWDLQGESSSQRRGLAEGVRLGRHIAPLRQEASLLIQAGTEDSKGRESGPSVLRSLSRGSPTVDAVSLRRGGAARRAGRAGGRRCRRASELVTTLSPAASIFSWSRVTGGFGSFSSTAACSAHQPERHVDARPASALRLLQPRPELVPGDDIRPAELERAVRGLGLHDAGREVGGDVVDPDRLDPLRARPDDRRHRRELRDPLELLRARHRRGRRRSSAGRSRARGRTTSRPAPSATSRGSRARDPSSPRSCRAPTSARTAARRRRAPRRSGRASPPPSPAGTPPGCPRGARRGGRPPPGPRPPAAGSPHRSSRPGPPPGSAAPRCFRPCARARAPCARRRRAAWTMCGPTKPVPPVTRILMTRSSSSTGSASAPAGPGTWSRASRRRRASRRPPSSARTRPGRSSSRSRS